MGKKIFRLAAAVAIMGIAFLCGPSVQAAEGKTYQIIYKAGNAGEFTAQYQEYAINTLGAVEAGEKKIVYEVTPGSAYPDLPQAGDIASSGYYVLPAQNWGPVDETVSKRSEYVVQYGRLADGVEYTVMFVDAASGEQVALPEIAMGNVGDTVSYTAKQVPDYKLDSEQEVSLVLGEDSSRNIITFTYSSDKVSGVEETVRVEYVDGGTTTEYHERENIIYNEAAVAGGGAGGDAQAEEDANAVGEDEGDVVTIPDEDTPLGDGGELAGDEQDTVKIEEEETPLSNLRMESPNKMVMGAIVAGVAAVLLAVIWVIVKKKSGTQKGE